MENFPTFKKYFLSENESMVTGNSVILMGGLDYRNGDRNISQQASILKSNSNKNVISHRYNDITGVKQSILENPDAYVVLFSAGGSYASQIAQLMKDKSKLFVVEPYASSANTANTVKSAVSMGVPTQNIITGPTKGRGLGVVPGTTQTPRGIDHWGALQYIGTLF